MTGTSAVQLRNGQLLDRRSPIGAVALAGALFFMLTSCTESPEEERGKGYRRDASSGRPIAPNKVDYSMRLLQSGRMSLREALTTARQSLPDAPGRKWEVVRGENALVLWRTAWRSSGSDDEVQAGRMEVTLYADGRTRVLPTDEDNEAWRFFGSQEVPLEELPRERDSAPPKIGLERAIALAVQSLGRLEKSESWEVEAFARRPKCWQMRLQVYESGISGFDAWVEVSVADDTTVELTRAPLAEDIVRRRFDQDQAARKADAAFAEGDYPKAVRHATEMIRLSSDGASGYTRRGLAYQLQGNVNQAIADYTEAIRLDGGDVRALNNLAWLLATYPDSTVRDGAEAMRLATRACELSNWESAAALSTLAAAYAEAGDFAKAVYWQKKALEMTPVSEGEGSRFAKHLELYQEGRPCREGCRRP